MCSGAHSEEGLFLKDRVPRAWRLCPFQGHIAVIWGHLSRAEPHLCVGLSSTQSNTSNYFLSLFCLLNTGYSIENNQGEEGEYQETQDEAGNCVINNGVRQVHTVANGEGRGCRDNGGAA